jgi:hypothetical protein
VATRVDHEPGADRVAPTVAERRISWSPSGVDARDDVVHALVQLTETRERASLCRGLRLGVRGPGRRLSPAFECDDGDDERRNSR